MVARIMTVALILGLFIGKEMAAAEATSLSAGVGHAVENRLAPDECQDCQADYYYDSFEGTWVAWIAYSQHGDGQCLYSLPECRRCNGNPGCEGFFDSRNFESAGAADLWLETNADCGNCNEGGGSLTAAVETRDAGKLAALIASSNGAVWLNQERAAIQARGCARAGMVGVHIAVDAGFLAAVTAEREQLGAGEALKY